MLAGGGGREGSGDATLSGLGYLRVVYSDTTILVAGFPNPGLQRRREAVLRVVPSILVLRRLSRMASFPPC